MTTKSSTLPLTAQDVKHQSIEYQNVETQQAVWTLSALHCSDCVKKIETVVGKLPGVSQAKVSYIGQTLHVIYDPTIATGATIATAVTDLGYSFADTHTVADTTVVDTTAVDTTGAVPVSSVPQTSPENRTHMPSFLQSLATTNIAAWPKSLKLSLLSGMTLVLTTVLGMNTLETMIGVAAAALWPCRLGLYLFAYAAGGYEASRHAILALRKGHVDIDGLMVIAALGAASLGHWAEGGLLLFLFSLGHALEHLAMDEARDAIRRLANLTPPTARIQLPDGTATTIPVADIRIGMTVIARAGERLPADGVVVSGYSSVDQASITGESIPVEKQVGDPVFAGTINGDGLLRIDVQKDPQDTVLARIIAHVQAVQANKAPTQTFTDRFQRWFTPLVLVTTTLVIVVPPLTGILGWEDSFLRAMTLLVAASPCALALATPSAVLAGLATAANHGVLIKGGAHLENAGMARVIAFDKTGTLTQGHPVVTEIGIRNRAFAQFIQLAQCAQPAQLPLHTTNQSRSHLPHHQLLAWVAVVESHSQHPLARAIVAAAADIPTTHATASVVTDNIDVKHVETHRGKGLVATLTLSLGETATESFSFLIGNSSLLAAHGLGDTDDMASNLRYCLDWKTWKAQKTRKTYATPSADTTTEYDEYNNTAGHNSKTHVWVAAKSAHQSTYMLLGCLALRDEPRPHVRQALAQLKDLGIVHLAMLTGDTAAVAKDIAAALPPGTFGSVQAGLLPEEKASRLAALQGKYGRIMMVGDGINDAAAMATADVGVAMGGAGSDVALETADIALMADNLLALPYMVALSRASRRLIVQNLIISLGVIALLVPSALLGTTGMGWAVVFHEGSTLVVVLNALRLLQFRYQPQRIQV